MEKLPLIEMEALNALTNVDSFHDEFIIGELDGTVIEKTSEDTEYSNPVRMNAMLVVITMQGTSRFCLDYVSYEIGKNQLVTIFPSHTIQLSYVSPDFQAKTLVVSKSFMDGWIEKRTPSMLNYLKLVRNPCTALEAKEGILLADLIIALRNKIKNRNHFFQREAIQVGLLGFIVELGNIFMSKKDGMIPPSFSRKEELLNKFLELLFIHCKAEHQVAFYADKLCISPQYLSLILNEQTGRSASKWIDDALMTEAKILLKLPNTTIQQVANELNFSDQSTFGKFFKKHKKMSPLEYRKS
ncbi:MAG: AraC family transcriptional regulator [Massilibacteroides sp.]|nr:AraC family transcriptional regulator [Massilibacteroides sp.]MDD3063348.1 AraC family transcriptional regulator [Massilibacteroides sp.]MDD4114209.1 AraC family transcriptional regulator [Massilibacteroides sp.]MDD4661182.1 AraC family transcriptional regulator [Massilibacteroides sp.]